LDYFNKFFIPWLKNNTEPVDFLFFTGNLFSNVNIYTLNKVQDLFDRISSIIRIKMIVGSNDRTVESKDNSINAYTIFKYNPNIEIITDFAYHEYINPYDCALIPWINIPYDKLTDIHFKNIFTSLDVNSIPFEFGLVSDNVYCGFSNDFSEDGSKVFIGSPYQLTKDQTSKKGFIVVDGEGYEFIDNTYSPTFKTINLQNEDDLKDLENKKEFIEKNHTTIVIGGELLNKKLKVDILLSKFNFSEIKYEIKEDPIVVESETVNINEMIEEAINNSPNKELLEAEYQNILDVFKTKI
jgi:hypothetical protein